MSKKLQAVIAGILPALLFLSLTWPGIIQDYLIKPFVREASMYTDMIVGFILLLYGIPIVVGIAGLSAWFLSPKSRWRMVGISVVCSVATLALGIFGTLQYDRYAAAKSHTHFSNAAMTHPTQEAQMLPLLDRARPITIATQLATSEVVVQSPFVVEAFVRDDIVRPDGTVHANIFVLVPGTTERKEIGAGPLLPTRHHSADGRSIFEGRLSFTDTFGAKSGYLSVIGKDEIVDAIEVTFANSEKGDEHR